MNDNFVILPDTTCDLSADIRKEFSIDYVSAHYTAPDGKERDCLLDWKKEGLGERNFLQGSSLPPQRLFHCSAQSRRICRRNRKKLPAKAKACLF